MCSFSGIADFQYMSTTRVTGGGDSGTAATSAATSASTSAEKLPPAMGPFGEEREELEVVPPLFTRQDYEFDYGFRGNTLSSGELCCCPRISRVGSCLRDQKITRDRVLNSKGSAVL